MFRTITKQLCITLTATLGLALVGCNVDEETTQPSSEKTESQSFAISVDNALQSECKAKLIGSAEGDNKLVPKLEVGVQGSIVKIIHTNVAENCSAKIQMVATPNLAKKEIRIDEVVSLPQVAMCDCYYDVSLEIKNLPTGAYTFQVFKAGNLIGKLTANTQSPDPIITNPNDTDKGVVTHLQSECKAKALGSAEGSAQFPSQLEAVVKGCMVTITHKNVIENCAAKIQMVPVLNTAKKEIRIEEVVNIPQVAMCDCYYDVSLVTKLASGTYAIEVFAADKSVGKTQFTIPAGC